VTGAASGRRGGLDYVPALDGVRGVAVLAVLLFHGGVAWLRGGFLGVDAFFVLSGYLITSLLLAGPTPDLKAFWGRRARRLVPALLAMSVVVVLVGRVAPINAAPRDALGALAYLANWRSIVGGGGYFGAFAEPSAFKHTWSLAVEGQFYLLWPLLVVLVCRRSRGAVLATAGIGALVSAAAMAASFSPYGDPARAYYGTDTRIQALFVGAALAVVLGARGESVRRRAFLSASGGVGVALTLWLWATASGSDGGLYRGGFLLTAVATAAVIASVVAVPGGPLARGLSARWLRLVGRVSYGVYLWHVPVYLLVTRSRTHLPGPMLLLLRVAVTFALAAVSWRLVEVPSRTWRPHMPPIPRRVANAAIVAMALATTLVWVRLLAPPATTSASAADSRPVAVETTAPPSSPAAARPATPGTPGAPVAPAGPAVRRPGGGAGRVMFIGDSVVKTLADGLRATDGVDVVNEGILGCGLAVGGPYRYFGGQYDDLPQCAQWEARWTAALRRDRPALVAILVGRWECMDRKHDGRWTHLGEAAYDAYVAAQLDRAVTLMSAGGTRVALLTAPYYLRGERPDGGRYPEDDPARVDAFNRVLRSVAARRPGVSVIDLNAALAPEGRFTKRINGTLVRYDGVHVSGAGARLLAPWLFPRLKAALA
jgi:peptidoglycan/LPS O-acetylase OafA/YrhL/lysophospholipase L1-like esterase